MTPRAYQMLALAKALELYYDHRMQVNTAYTPVNMMKTAEKLLDMKFKARSYLHAAGCLRAKAAQLTEEDKDT